MSHQLYTNRIHICSPKFRVLVLLFTLVLTRSDTHSYISTSYCANKNTYYYLARNVAVLKQGRRTRRKQPDRRLCISKVKRRILVFFGVTTMGKATHFGNTIWDCYKWGKLDSGGQVSNNSTNNEHIYIYSPSQLTKDFIYGISYLVSRCFLECFMLK